MTSATLHPSKTVFDGWRSISISLFMTLVGYGVLVGVPVISADRAGTGDRLLNWCARCAAPGTARPYQYIRKTLLRPQPS